MTPREFCVMLRNAGCAAGLEHHGGWPLPAGHLLDGRSWTVSASGGPPGDPDEPMPERVTLRVYQSEAETARRRPGGRGLPGVSVLAGVLRGCSAGQAASAVRRADEGDYAALSPVVPGARVAPPPPGTRPPEGTLTLGGAPLFGVDAREYLRLARLAPPDTIAPWRTATCPECGDSIQGNGVVVTPDGAAAHVMAGGAVILGCEGYFVISPAAVGLEPGLWHDWRDDHSPPARVQGDSAENNLGAALYEVTRAVRGPGGQVVFDVRASMPGFTPQLVSVTIGPDGTVADVTDIGVPGPVTGPRRGGAVSAAAGYLRAGHPVIPAPGPALPRVPGRATGRGPAGPRRPAAR